MTVEAFFAFLEEDSYLPLVQGNDVAWELRNINGEQGAYFTKTKETLQADALLKTMIEGANGDNQFELTILHLKLILIEKRKHENCRL